MQELSIVAGNELSATVETDMKIISLHLNQFENEGTQASYANIIAGFLSWGGIKSLKEVNHQMAMEYRNYLIDTYKAATAKLRLAAVTGLFKTATNVGWLLANPFTGIRPVKGDAETVHDRILNETEVMKMLDVEGLRPHHKAFVTLLYASGLRVSEAIALTWGDLSIDGVLRVRNGKGGKQRFVKVSTHVTEMVLGIRGSATDEDLIFGFKQGMARKIVKRAAKLAGLKKSPTPHWLRHSHASHAMARGANVLVVRDTLGHSNLSTTNIYLHSNPNDSSGLHLAV